jgi:hypothetical protein
VLRSRPLDPQNRLAQVVGIGTKEHDAVAGRAGAPTLPAAVGRLNSSGSAAARATWTILGEPGDAPAAEAASQRGILGAAPLTARRKQKVGPRARPPHGLMAPALCPGNHPFAARPAQIDGVAGSSYPPRPTGTHPFRPLSLCQTDAH